MALSQARFISQLGCYHNSFQNGIVCERTRSFAPGGNIFILVISPFGDTNLFRRLKGYLERRSPFFRLSLVNF